MKRIRIPRPLQAAVLVAVAFLLAGCPTDGRRDALEYLRSPVTFRMDPVPADHPFCFDPAKRPDGIDEATCRATGKYRLRWERPEDTVGFREYRIYLDTTPPNSMLPWPQVRRDRSLASFVMEGTPPGTDSIIFMLSDTGAVPAFVERTTPRIQVLDTTGRRDEESGSLIFAIVTSYGEPGREGQPRYTWVITDDRFPPYPPQPEYTPAARTLRLDWARPRDPVSFFDPGADSGVILAYYVRIFRSGVLNANRPGNFDSVRVTEYRVGGVDRTAEVDSTHFTTYRGAPGRLFRLPDSSRVLHPDAAHPADSLRLVIAGLLPMDTVDVSFWAVDLAGNVKREDSSGTVRIILTDTTQPTRPLLAIVDSARNGFIYSFTASRDLVETGSGLAPAPSPNANILEYRLTRTLVSGTGSGTDLNKTWPVPANQRGNNVFLDTARYLPPGSTYRITVRAVDSTGHASETDTLLVSTLATRFPGADSALACPPGFVAVAGGRFLRGDTANLVSTPDEQPAIMLDAEPYCIEASEHRDASGAFATRVTWQQAHDICRDLSASMTPADSTWLCTEGEWERACEGAEPDVPLVYGMQSERLDPAGVRYTCNIGTGDSAMALDAALRDPACITYDGAYDMSGNLAEWVLDGHTLEPGTLTLAGYPETQDTVLRRGVPHTSPDAPGVVRGFRGSHYLNPNQSPSILLARARCSNRDYATQSRPQPFPGCVSAAGPQLVVTYNGKPPRCLPLPDSIPAAQISQVSTARDSSQILILLQGQAQPVVYQMPPDTAYAQRPAGAELSRRTLAVVSFVNSETSETIIDTLNALEILNASPENRHLIFQREAAPPWSVATSGGEPVITYLYAHVQTRNLPAKAYYSNRVLGFRCCARPRAP